MHAKQNDPEGVRRARVRQLFIARHPENATENDVFLSFGWLQQHHPNLLPKGKHGDPYQHLRVNLEGLYHD
jgi:hypothetical protein